jgi:hypothetical protein
MPARLFCVVAATALVLPSVAGAEPCPNRGFEFFELEGYRTRNVRLSGFWLLPGALLTGNEPVNDLAGKAFTKRGILEGKSMLRERMIATPALFDSPVGVTVIGARVVNCGAGEGGVKELDIEYPLFTTKFPLGAIRTAEQTSLEREHPAEALALAPVKSRFRVTPRLGYDASQNLFAGGRMEVRSRSPSGLMFGVDAQGSDETAVGSAAISGTLERERGWLRQFVWRGMFEYADLPSDAVSLDSYRGLGQISLRTAPLGRSGAIVRFGSLFEGGHERTGLPASSLPSDLLAESLFANWRSYAGVSARTGRTSMAVSYGLLLGRTGSGGLVDYRKQVVDARYDARFLVAPQHPLSVETRFNAGTLARLGPTPESERFFGGNVETPFIPGSEWAIRANPVMRGIPAYRLNRNAPNQAPGADRFAVLNLTASIPVLGLPVIPNEAARDPEVRGAVQGFMKDGAESLIPVYELDDPAQKNLFDNVRGGFAKTTEAMEARIRQLESSTTEGLKDAYQACSEKIGDLAFDAGNITKRTPWRVFLNPDPEERGIPVIIDKCLDQLNGPLKDAELERLGEELREHQRRIAEQVSKIDRERARRLAEETLAFPSKVMQTVFDEMTVVSVSPVVVFDVGRISPDAADWRSTRYSVGCGARLTLASSVSIEIGYAWNLRPREWEGRGALFVALRFIDLFGR